ncbi:MAG: hypothetical protein QOH05_2254 [Acetobacteraceae bacterium]|nr:hypothetical protein [Acetobacteraceae bacterium]
MKAASSTKPPQSVPRESGRVALAPSAPAAMPALASAIIAMLSQNITRQPTRCVTTPPNSGPMLKPSMRNPVHAPIAAARRSGGITVPSAASVLGTASAEAKPCKARPVSSVAALVESAIMADAAANSARPAIATRRAPRRSEASPPSTMQAAETTR